MWAGIMSTPAQVYSHSNIYQSWCHYFVLVSLWMWCIATNNPLHVLKCSQHLRGVMYPCLHRVSLSLAADTINLLSPSWPRLDVTPSQAPSHISWYGNMKEMPLLSNLWVGYLIMLDEKIPIYSRLQILLITLITDFRGWMMGMSR